MLVGLVGAESCSPWVVCWLVQRRLVGNWFVCWSVSPETGPRNNLKTAAGLKHEFLPEHNLRIERKILPVPIFGCLFFRKQNLNIRTVVCQTYRMASVSSLTSPQLRQSAASRHVKSPNLLPFCYGECLSRVEWPGNRPKRVFLRCSRLIADRMTAILSITKKKYTYRKARVVSPRANIIDRTATAHVRRGR